MLKKKYIIASVYIAPFLIIIGGIISLVLGYKGILAFEFKKIIKDLIYM
jgi:hypothetical protein